MTGTTMIDPPVVLITGATGPIGRAVARRLGAGGARLALAGRDQTRLDTMGAELAAGLSATPGVDASAVVSAWTKMVGDPTDVASARDMAAAVEARYGRIDVLLHLVGGWVGGTSVVDLDRDELREMLDRHLWSALNMVQAVVPGMTGRGYGRVIAVSSPVAANPGPRGASYAIAKSAEELLLRSMARELAGTGVTANIVTIRGLIDPAEPVTDRAPRKMGWATPDEIADAVAFLASPASATVNGERIALGGG